jgi:DDE superfamily endonuclease
VEQPELHLGQTGPDALSENQRQAQSLQSLWCHRVLQRTVVLSGHPRSLQWPELSRVCALRVEPNQGASLLDSGWGALLRYHTGASTQQFFAEHQQRITVWQLPSYSADYNPIEYLWRNTQKDATHNKYFAQFEQLTQAVEKTLTAFAGAPQQVLGLFGRYYKETGLLPQQLKLAT